MRTFSTGATRDNDETKIDYEGFLSPLVLQRFGEYMTEHRKQADGQLRASDNWQKGIPLDAYIKSAFRHFVDWWTLHRAGTTGGKELEDALAAMFFNVQGYLHEVILARPHTAEGLPTPTDDQYACGTQGHSFDSPRFAADCECYYCGLPNPNA